MHKLYKEINKSKTVSEFWNSILEYKFYKPVDSVNIELDRTELSIVTQNIKQLIKSGKSGRRN